MYAVFYNGGHVMKFIFRGVSKMDKIKKMIPYLIIFIIIIYSLLLIFASVNFDMLAFALFLFYMPFIYFIISLVYGILNRFEPVQLLFPIFLGILFIPAVFIFFNYTALFYIFVYTIISFIGNGFGYIISKLFKRSN